MKIHDRIKDWWERIKARFASKGDATKKEAKESLPQKTRRLTRDYWFVLVLVALVTAPICYLYYDGRQPAPKPKPVPAWSAGVPGELTGSIDQLVAEMVRHPQRYSQIYTVKNPCDGRVTHIWLRSKDPTVSDKLAPLLTSDNKEIERIFAQVPRAEKLDVDRPGAWSVGPSIARDSVVDPRASCATKGTIGGGSSADSASNNDIVHSSGGLFGTIGWIGWQLFPLVVVSLGIMLIWYLYNYGFAIPFRLVTASRGKGIVGAMSSSPGGGVGGGLGGEQGVTSTEFMKVFKPEDLSSLTWDDVVVTPSVREEIELMIEGITRQKAVWDVAKATFDLEKEANNKRWHAKPMDNMPQVPALPKTRNGAKIDKNRLLYGPPGTGKTLLAMLIAYLCKIPVILVTGSAFDDKLQGEGAARVRYLFQQARMLGLCLIFFDEVDTVAEGRHASIGANNTQTLNELLGQMQGFNNEKLNAGIWLLAATNRLGALDDAFGRSGRFGKKIPVDPPRLSGRVKLFKIFTKDLKLAVTIKIESLCTMLSGKTGADFQSICNEIAIRADEVDKSETQRLQDQAKSRALVAKQEDIDAHLAARTVGPDEVIEGILRFLMGRINRDGEFTFMDLFNTDVHEGFHALMTYLMGLLSWSKDRVRLLSIEPRDRALGMIFATPDTDPVSMSYRQVEGKVMVGLAGSVAQMLFNDDTSPFGLDIALYRDSGPDNDFENCAKSLHVALSRHYGSVKLGPLSLGRDKNTALTEMGPTWKDRIDDAVNHRLRLVYGMCWTVGKIFLHSDVLWEIFEEALLKKLILEERLYELFDKLMADLESKGFGRAYIEKEMADFRNRWEDNPAGWVPERLPAQTRATVNRRIEGLRVQWEAANTKAS
jgi:ATP-dependent Zn protease